MDFSYSLVSLRSLALDMDYFLVPWDTEIMGRRVAEIKKIAVHDSEQAQIQFETFENWLKSENIDFCSCRIGHDLIVETDFIQKHNFKFIELNYRPQINNLQLLDLSNEMVEIQLAAPADKEHLADMAKSIFKYGRFHQDIALGDEIGNDRYKTWMVNAFSLPFQSVYKCIISNKIAGFFVVEATEKKCHWALTGLAPGLNNRGMGTRVWKSMMHFHQAQGVESITTSISSHNTAVLNLYAKLNFRFPTPAATFHWHR